MAQPWCIDPSVKLQEFAERQEDRRNKEKNKEIFCSFQPTWRTAMQRKKIFEYFRNCSKRNFGKKLNIEYLLVLIWLLIYL